jgi:hypothetical protein
VPLPKNQNYKMRYRPNYAHVGRYKTLPPPMAGDPQRCWDNWDSRCSAIYAHMIAIKHGIVPPSNRRGLWFYEEKSS